ncbi:MAG: hypothetical protein R3F13_05655 [Prosthecobacter sp.]
MTSLDAAKDTLPLSDLWRLRGWPHEPARECFCPFRPDDRRKSFSVFTNASGEELAKDFKSGDVFDAPALLAAVEGLDMKDACRLFIEAAGMKGEPPLRRHGPRVRQIITPAAPVREKPLLPALRAPTSDEAEQIARQRHVSPECVLHAASLGLLFVASWRGFPAWCITDSARWNCQFRRMDGKPFPHPAGAKKTLAAPGAWASWPIGAADLAKAESVLLVEGSGDFLAAWHFITAEHLHGRCTAVCMTGAANWIPSEALPEIARRHVRIFPHLDTSHAGEEAALRWETQLTKAGGAAHCFDLSGLVTVAGDAVGDFNDVLLMERREIEELGSIAAF